MSSTDEQQADAFTRELARCLTEAKDRSDYSIRSLAEAAKLGVSTVQRYLDGRREIPVPALRRLATLLGTTAVELMREAEAGVG